MPGSTAYGGLDVLQPKEGETILVSAASGAVGISIGMLAKALFGCKVIGSCGGEEKCNIIVSEFGFDHAIDYKKVSSAQELKEMISAVAPKGIDMYFEGVGGIHLEAALDLLRTNGRIAVCGQISDYNRNPNDPHKYPISVANMIYKCQRIEGFVCTPWLDGKKGRFLSDMSKWLQEGKVKPKETFFDGIEQWPLAFQSLFTGKHLGKVVVRV